MKKTRKGFTLVELLIVIVVIGILAAMMMLSSNEAVSSARVSTITSNMRNLKTATLAFYNDNMSDYETKTPTLAQVLPYLNGKDEIPESNDYNIQAVTGEGGNLSWYIVYKASSLPASDSKIKTKLGARAKALGLVKAADKYDTPYDKDGDVALQVR